MEKPMSLEAAVAENTATMKELIAELKATNAGRTEAVAAITAGVAGRPAGAKTGGAKKDPAPAAEPKAETPAAPEPESKAEGPMSIDDFRAKAVAFIGVEDAAEKAKRNEFIRSINSHLGIAKVVETAEADRAKVAGWFDSFAAGEAVNFSEGEDDGIG
jgi:hypothetical protein